MTAQVIRLSAYRHAPAVPTAKPRRRVMSLSDKSAEVLARINRGEIVTNIGQIDKDTRRVLDKLTKRGYLYKGTDYTFPIEKTCWAGAAHDGEGLPLNYKFREL